MSDELLVGLITGSLGLLGTGLAGFLNLRRRRSTNETTVRTTETKKDEVVLTAVVKRDEVLAPVLLEQLAESSNKIDQLRTDFYEKLSQRDDTITGLKLSQAELGEKYRDIADAESRCKDALAEMHVELSEKYMMIDSLTKAQDTIGGELDRLREDAKLRPSGVQAAVRRHHSPQPFPAVPEDPTKVK